VLTDQDEKDEYTAANHSADGKGDSPIGVRKEIEKVPFVFVNVETRGVVKAPRRPLYRGRQDAKLAWVGFHDFRHSRATQWILRGIDIRTVQGLLGHRDIQTTMRYAHFAPDHAAKRVIEVQKLEAAELVGQNVQQACDEGLRQAGQNC
jgi:integrase